MTTPKETELQELQRLSDAGISISYEEIYISLSESPQSSNEQIIFVPEHQQILDEEIRASLPIIIPTKIIEPVIVEFQQPVEVIQEPEEVIEDPEKYTDEEKIIIDILEDCKKNYTGTGETTELQELQRLWDAGISIISEEIYISLTKKLSGN
jgi:hypothetical protein